MRPRALPSMTSGDRSSIRPWAFVPLCAQWPQKLIVLDEMRMRLIDHRAIGAASHIGIEHSALDGEAPFGEILPEVPPGHGRPADTQLLPGGVQRQKHPGMIADR